MPDFDVRGADDLERLAKALKAQGRGDLRKEMLRGFREAGKPVIAEVKKSAESLPSSGGLAAKVAASKFSTRSRLAGKQAGIRLAATSGYQIIGMDRGRLRHPVFGRTDTWVGQSVPEGWFRTPIEGSVDQFRRGLQNVMEDIARKVERSV